MMGILINITLLVTAAALGLLAVKTVLGNRITPRGHMLMWLVLAAVLATVPFTGILPRRSLRQEIMCRRLRTAA